MNRPNQSLESIVRMNSLKQIPVYQFESCVQADDLPVNHATSVWPPGNQHHL